ncbi:Retrotransposon protein [Nesidiocoris tenuis]|uniref:Retrotransposon protein n=1 Tax=Nesidiocoris tenuis TaxID=355587 RepID=A0ABN7B4X7_9HEMI|nr:Retrotransposon protein [Nesidiocoris tenuis]
MYVGRPLGPQDADVEEIRNLSDELANGCHEPVPRRFHPYIRQVELMLYDGTSAWEEYRTHLDVVATVNGWGEVRKAQELACALRGSALTVLNPARKR